MDEISKPTAAAERQSATVNPSAPFPLVGTFTTLAVISLAIMVVVILIGRNPLPRTVAIVCLLGISCIFSALAFQLTRLPTSRMLWPSLTFIAALAAGPAYFFGPNSSFAAATVLLLIFLGMLSTAREHRPTTKTVALCYLLLTTGQAAIVVLTLGKMIPDQSLVEVAIADHPNWHHLAAHLLIQVGHFIAFLFGRSLRVRYEELAQTVADETRETLIQRALVAEARQEYEMALAAARTGMNRDRKEKRPANTGSHQVMNGNDPPHSAETTIRLTSPNPADTHTRQPSRAPLSTNLSDFESGQSFSIKRQARPTKVIESTTLADHIHSHSPLCGDILKSLITDICGELLDLHESGSIHLEVSPWLCQFRSQRWTLNSSGLGGPPTPETIAFIAPERFTSAVAGKSADVFSLCATIYFATTGQIPFSELDIVSLQRSRPLPQAPDLPAPLRDALLVGLVSEPSQRYPNIVEARDALVAALEGAPTATVHPPHLDLAGDWHPLDKQPSSPTEPTNDALRRGEQATSNRLWDAAYRKKIKVTIAGLTLVCLGGAALFSLVISDSRALIIGITGFVGMILSAWAYAFITRNHSESSGRSNREVRWPWILVALFSIGPAFAIGFNSAFAGFVTLGLFSAGLFQANEQASTLTKSSVAIALSGATALVLLLIAIGVIPDISNIKMFQPLASNAEVLILHSLLVGSYGLAFSIGRSIDRRYEALAEKAQAAALEAARQATLLIATKAEIARLLEAETIGLFSSHRLGEYTTGRLLGRGGMGEVYLARHHAHDRVVALKVLRFDRVDNPDHLHLFFSEAEALGQISSPHVARVLEVGNFDQGLPFIAMEFIDGDALDQRLADDSHLNIESTREMVADIGAGLVAVHRADILHRDIKPANIILTRGDTESRWKLVDFGVAAIGIDHPPSNSAQLIVGTPRYMSPEQACGHPLHSSSDLYSFSLVVYRALTGQLALDGDNPTAIIAAQRRGIVNPSLYTSIPNDIVLVLRIGLATRPSDRFATAEEFRDAFEDAFANRLDAKWRMLATALLAREPWRSPVP